MGFQPSLEQPLQWLVDVFSPDKRSAVMARIRGSGNKDTELRMIALMRTHGIAGWRRKVMLPGKPDFVFRRERVAVFVDGCFWHGCPKPKHPHYPKLAPTGGQRNWGGTKSAIAK